MSQCPLCRKAKNKIKAQIKEKFPWQGAFLKSEQSGGRKKPSPPVVEKIYFECLNCHLIFLDSQFHLSSDIEKSRYEEHNNDIEDPKYQDFLNQLWRPLQQKLTAGSEGLDYGCGPGPALLKIMSSNGYKVRGYDPYFHDDLSIFDSQYDFIVCTEVVEHFQFPDREFKKLSQLLKAKAYLGVMTKLYHNKIDFIHWYYRKDPTHVCFYQEETMTWIADQFNWQVEILSDQVILFCTDSI